MESFCLGGSEVYRMRIPLFQPIIIHYSLWIWIRCKKKKNGVVLKEVSKVNYCSI